MLSILLVGAVSLLSSGCTSDADTSRTEARTAQETPAPRGETAAEASLTEREADPNASTDIADVYTILSGSSPPVRAMRSIVARDQAKLDEVWDLAGVDPSTDDRVGAVDLRTHTVVGFFAGERATGGYAIEVKMSKEERGTVLNAEVVAPPIGAMVTQAFTYPFVVVAIPRGDEEVRVEFRERSARDSIAPR